MNTGVDITELLQPYLEAQHALSQEALRGLVAEWNQEGTFLDFLVGKQLIPSSTARTLEAVRKGYLNVTLESVLGLTAKPAAPVVAPAWENSATISISPAIEEAAPPSARPAAVLPHLLPTKPAAGMRIGRYVLQEQLGEGATATVFRAFNQTLNIPVAIKIFAPLDEFADPEAAARFRHEAQTLVRLDHPHIVRILDADIAEPFPYIVMEYVGETTLETQIQNLGKLPGPRIAQIGLAVADALESARKAGLLHRDVKPSNILERRDGHIKLVDFGIVARQLPEGGLSDPQAALGYISGTPLYIAPEQVMRPDRIDFRADMYALGATLYHAAVGRPPLVRETPLETMMAQVHDEPVPIWKIDPSFDVHLAATIHRMLRKQPAERFNSWADVRAALAYAPVPDSSETPARSLNRGSLNDSAESQATADSAPIIAPARPPDPQPEPPRPSLKQPSERLVRKWTGLPPSRQTAVVGVLLLLILLAGIWFGMRT